MHVEGQTSLERLRTKLPLIMSQLLTARQAEELHKSIIAYLASVNLTESSAALRAELGDSVSIDDATLKKYEGLLEKKWTSVVRLQKKVGS